jgi:hypothetical protein
MLLPWWPSPYALASSPQRALGWPLAPRVASPARALHRAQRRGWHRWPGVAARRGSRPAGQPSLPARELCLLPSTCSLSSPSWRVRATCRSSRVARASSSCCLRRSCAASMLIHTSIVLFGVLSRADLCVIRAYRALVHA